MKVKNEFKKRIKPKQKSCRGNEEFIDFMEQNWGTFNDHINELNGEQKEHIKKHFNGLFEGEEANMGDALFEDDFEDFNDQWKQLPHDDLRKAFAA